MQIGGDVVVQQATTYGEETSLRPIYLTGEKVYLRALVASDKDHAAAWFDSPFPINATRAEEFLKESHKDPWGAADVTHLAVVRREDDAVVGGATLECPGWRAAWLSVRIAPWLEDGDELRADALRIAIPWLRDEVELMTVTVPIAADELATISAAESLGMVHGARLREARARPGHRVDLFYFQALNPRWEVRDGNA